MKPNKEQYNEALATRARAMEMHAAYVDSNGADPALLASILRFVQPGLYEHFKSAPDDLKFYIVLGAQMEVDSHRPTVAYSSLYGARGGTLAGRHLFDQENGFLTPISRETYMGPRFKLITPLALHEAAMILQGAPLISWTKGRERFFEDVSNYAGRRISE